MRTFLFVILLASTSGAQTSPTDIDAIQSRLLADLRGYSDVSGPPPAPFDRTPIAIEGPKPPNGPAVGPVSAAHLRHTPPHQAQKALSRATRFSQAGDHPRAVIEFQKAIASDPDYDIPHHRLGVEYAMLGRFTEGESELRRATELDPTDWSSQYDLAVLLCDSGNFSEAEPAARRAVELSKTNASANLLLGALLYRHDESRADGLAHIQYAARTSPKAKELLKSLPPS